MRPFETKVSILIVGYNSKELIRDCLTSLFLNTSRAELSFEVIVVDNSSDGTAEMVSEHFPEVHVVANLDNRGFGAGNNLAASHASGKYLLLLNPDTIVRSNKALVRLVEFADSNPHAAAWGGVTLLESGEIDPGCYLRLPSLALALKNLFGIHGKSHQLVDRSPTFCGEVEVLNGAYMMVDRAVWNGIGGFDESFKLYSEEVDLCYRIGQTGRPIMMTGASRIKHLAGSGNAFQSTRMLARTRGQMHYARKHFSTPGWIAMGCILWMHAAVRYCIGNVLGCLPKQKKAARVASAYSLIFWQPTKWWHGWNGVQL
ncbi:Rhamnosyltransferase WbbL [Aureliella helgolandensis]|uniref:Rhamnosyltransferase WbbL n=2 Tax=Aureliella helgolandensis TaxID=2527968 RepID=A0A518GFG6_9BACT|nr:Rhamnosyltransferase WbbL [Aureliella helgolandensis]